MLGGSGLDLMVMTCSSLGSVANGKASVGGSVCVVVAGRSEHIRYVVHGEEVEEMRAEAKKL